jgi:hypothetical protein
LQKLRRRWLSKPLLLGGCGKDGLAGHESGKGNRRKEMS